MRSWIAKNCWIVFLSVTLWSCAHTVTPLSQEMEFPVNSQSENRRTEAPAREPSGGNETNAPVDLRAEIAKIIAETNRDLSERPGEEDSAPLVIPMEINRRVEMWIKYFTEREREMTVRYLERGEPLRPHIEAILKENEVPSDLYYLAMIESGFRSHARSRAKAVGIWQFLKGTGKNYRMVINSSVDERRNWIKDRKSTRLNSSHT